MSQVLESLEEIHSTTPHNRWNKDAHHLYIWNSLHGVAHGIDASQLLYSSQRHDFVPSYVICNCPSQIRKGGSGHEKVN